LIVTPALGGGLAFDMCGAIRRAFLSTGSPPARGWQGGAHDQNQKTASGEGCGFSISDVRSEAWMGSKSTGTLRRSCWKLDLFFYSAAQMWH